MKKLLVSILASVLSIFAAKASLPQENQVDVSDLNAIDQLHQNLCEADESDIPGDAIQAKLCTNFGTENEDLRDNSFSN